jgi:hypothetical protein
MLLTAALVSLSIRGPIMRSINSVGLLLIAVNVLNADEHVPFRFNRMFAHWVEYDKPDYLAIIDDAKPELVQVGFYGAHFYSLAHTPYGKGYPGHFPVEGLKELGDWQQKLNGELHKRGVKVIGHFNVEFLVGDPDTPKGPTGFFKFYRELWDEKTLGKKPVADPLDLLEKGPDGKPIVNNNYSIGGMKEHWACLNNPHWKTVLKAWIKAGIDRGVDGFVANYFYRHNCLCEHCQKGFRQHLRDRYSAAQMKDLFDIADIDKHTFKEIGGWHDPKQSTPLKREMLRFSQVSTKKTFDEVFVKHGRSLKPDLIVAQWNHLGNFSQISGDERCLLPAELWSKDEDYLWYSTGDAAYFTDLKEGILGEGTLQARYIRGASGNKSYTLGKYESTRIRAAIAELAANGGAPMGFYTRQRDPDARKEIVRYYGFLRQNDALYKANTSHAEVVLLYPRSRVFEGDLAAVETFRKFGKKLLDEHVLFDVLPDDAVAAGLRKPAQGQRVLSVKEAEKELKRDGLSRFDAPTTVRVSMSTPAKGDELTLHLVNYNRTEPGTKRSAGSGIVDEKPIAVEQVQADIVLPAGKRAVKVECFSPESPEPVVVKTEEKDGHLRFTVPRFLVYSMTRIQLAAR